MGILENFQPLSSRFPPLCGMENVFCWAQSKRQKWLLSNQAEFDQPHMGGRGALGLPGRGPENAQKRTVQGTSGAFGAGSAMAKCPGIFGHLRNPPPSPRGVGPFGHLATFGNGHWPKKKIPAGSTPGGHCRPFLADPTPAGGGGGQKPVTLENPASHPRGSISHTRQAMAWFKNVFFRGF